MIKLSELTMDTLLIVGGWVDNLEVMDKQDFLDSDYFLNYPDEPFPIVTLAEKEILHFDLWDCIERIGDGEAYDGWDEDVYDYIKDQPETIAFLKLVKKVFESRPIYYDGESVEIDMFPEGENQHGKTEETT